MAMDFNGGLSLVLMSAPQPAAPQVVGGLPLPTVGACPCMQGAVSTMDALAAANPQWRVPYIPQVPGANPYATPLDSWGQLVVVPPIPVVNTPRYIYGQ